MIGRAALLGATLIQDRRRRRRSPAPFGPEPLSPLTFLERAVAAHGDRVAVVDGPRTLSYVAFERHCRKLAGALVAAGVQRGDRVAVLAPNSPTALASTFAVPWAGAVLVALNTRLSAPELAYILEHCGAKVLIADNGSLENPAREAAARLESPPTLMFDGLGGDLEGRVANAAPLQRHPAREQDLLSINYTSGTTGRPKGVMYTHRGAYLQALAMVAHCGLTPDSSFLWTLPMFHCNGWCFPWAVTAVGAKHVCLRRVEPQRVWEAIRQEGVTHFNAAPTVLVDLAASPAAATVPPGSRIRVATGGAPPSPSLLASVAELGLDVTHLYGLTETYGPAVICEWTRDRAELPADDSARLRARQGVSNVVGMPLRVVDANGEDAPHDGSTQGEVVLRGNNVMLGYYRDDAATAAASVDGWFRTGDVGVIHPDGYLELRDRVKDVIISGGENIASIEVEQAIQAHPDVLECAVVGAPDDRWGEVPVAFVTLRPGAEVSSEHLIDFCKRRTARYKAPKRVVFGSLPKTATGKVRKFELRQLAAGQDAAASSRAAVAHNNGSLPSGPTS